MRLLSATRYSVKICLKSSLLRPPIASSLSPCFPQRLPRVSLHPSFASLRRTFASSSRVFQPPTPRTDHDHEPEEETKPISEKPQAVGAKKIWTIPNVLTISRVLSCPALGYAILHDNFYVATGLLVYAGLTDLVRVQVLRFASRSCSSIPSFHMSRSMGTWHGNTTWVRSLARSLTQRRTRR
jgi:hypothetical protein